MFTKHLKCLHSQITSDQLDKLKLQFRRQFSKRAVLGVIKRDHYEIMKKKAWLKSSGWYDWRIWKPVFNVLKEAPVQRIYFTNFRNPDIIYDVVHVSFPKLRELHLEDNAIVSIEPLIALQVPNIRKVCLQRNLLMSIRSLKRCFWPLLQELNISDNCILSCEQIAEIQAPNLNRIVLQEKTYLNIYMLYQEGRGQRQLKSNSNVNGYDMRWLLKLQSPTVQYIKYAADQRIHDEFLQEQIGIKYYKIRVEKRGMDMGSLLPLLSF